MSGGNPFKSIETYTLGSAQSVTIQGSGIVTVIDSTTSYYYGYTVIDGIQKYAGGINLFSSSLKIFTDNNASLKVTVAIFN